MQVYLSDGIFIISEDNNSYQERLDIFKDTINKYFSHDNVRYTVLTNELYYALSEYKESLGNDSFRFDSTFDYCIYDGCWIKGWLSSLEQNRYSIQKFIKIIDGLYVSNVEIPLKKDDIVLLEDGDITFKESITRKELQNMIDSRIEPTDKYRYIINTNKPIYKMELSDNYKNKIKDNNYYIHLIFKIDKDELKISSKNNLYLFDSNKKQNDQNVNYSNIIAFGDMIKQYSDDDDDEFKKFALSKYTYIDVLIPIKDLENQYFWIGNQTREELNNNVEE